MLTVMPLRVGIDLVAVAGVRASVDEHADRYLERVYTEREVADCRTEAGVDATRLAARFAAKEAAMKVLRPGRDDAVPWPEIEIRRDPAGHVDVELSGHAAVLAARADLTALTVSLTHEEGFAIAVVVAECGSERR